MSHELIYTSAPKGLRPGSRGFCTVVSTQGLPAALVERLEGLSGYRHAYPPQTPNAHLNPVASSHLVLSSGGRSWHLLSRVCDAEFDYSQRTNKLAHHVLLDANELPQAGPAWLLGQPGFMQTGWDGQPRVLPSGRLPPMLDAPPQVCQRWAQLCGDAGWGGVLAETGASGRPAVLVFRPGVDPLGLICEALALLPPAERWKVSFSTYYTRLPAGVDCQWRCVLEGSPEAAPSSRPPQALVIDLARPGPLAARGPWVQAACAGSVVRAPQGGGKTAALQPAGVPLSADSAGGGEFDLQAYDALPDARWPDASFPRSASQSPQPKSKAGASWPWYLAAATIVVAGLGGATFRLAVRNRDADPTGLTTRGLATPKIVVTADGCVYNGQPYTASAKVIDPKKEDVEELNSAKVVLTYYRGGAAGETPLGGPPVDADEYTVVASFTGSDHYGPAPSERKKFKIKPATPQISVDAPGGTYTGQPFIAKPIFEGDVGKNKNIALKYLALPVTYYHEGDEINDKNKMIDAPTDAGSYIAVVTFPRDANYDSAPSVDRRFDIKQAETKVALEAPDRTYTGNPWPARARLRRADGKLVDALDDAKPKIFYYRGKDTHGEHLPGPPADVGAYTVVASFSGTTNYLQAKGTANFDITPRVAEPPQTGQTGIGDAKRNPLQTDEPPVPLFRQEGAAQGLTLSLTPAVFRSHFALEPVPKAAGQWALRPAAQVGAAAAARGFFKMDKGVCLFSWSPNFIWSRETESGASDVEQLRNCVLLVEGPAESPPRYVAFRAPLPAEPFALAPLLDPKEDREASHTAPKPVRLFKTITGIKNLPPLQSLEFAGRVGKIPATVRPPKGLTAAYDFVVEVGDAVKAEFGLRIEQPGKQSLKLTLEYRGVRCGSPEPQLVSLQRAKKELDEWSQALKEQKGKGSPHQKGDSDEQRRQELETLKQAAEQSRKVWEHLQRLSEGSLEYGISFSVEGCAVILLQTPAEPARPQLRD